MVTNKSLVYAAHPSGYPLAGEHLKVTSNNLDITTAPPGGLVVKNLYVSFDPYQRGRMHAPPSLLPPEFPLYALNAVIPNLGISRVLVSDSKTFAPGDIITGSTGTSQYTALTEAEVGDFKLLSNPHNLPLSYFTEILAMPGLMAYSSLQRIGRPKKGETVFVSAAAGAVGSVVGQLALREGLSVVGSVGSDEKVGFVEGLGFRGFNYKTESPEDALKRLVLGGIDIYYDNVGGEHLEAALANANVGARFIECGMISIYHVDPLTAAYRPGNLFKIIEKRIKIEGFVAGDPGFAAYAQEHMENMGRWPKEGSVVAQEGVTGGIEHAAEGLAGIFKGENVGKAVLKVWAN